MRVGSMKEMRERWAEERLEVRWDVTEEGVVDEDGVERRRSVRWVSMVGV